MEINVDNMEDNNKEYGLSLFGDDDEWDEDKMFEKSLAGKLIKKLDMACNRVVRSQLNIEVIPEYSFNDIEYIRYVLDEAHGAADDVIKYTDETIAEIKRLMKVIDLLKFQLEQSQREVSSYILREDEMFAFLRTYDEKKAAKQLFEQNLEIKRLKEELEKYESMHMLIDDPAEYGKKKENIE